MSAVWLLRSVDLSGRHTVSVYASELGACESMDQLQWACGFEGCVQSDTLALDFGATHLVEASGWFFPDGQIQAAWIERHELQA